MASVVLSDPEIMSGMPCFRVEKEQAITALEEARELLLAPFDAAVAR